MEHPDPRTCIDVVFDRLPGGPDDMPRFIETEDTATGASINAGEWVTRPDGLVALRIPIVPSEGMTVAQLVERSHGASKASGWWTDIKTGELLDPVALVPEKLCLIHSEISEGLEGHRKNLADDKLPHRSMLEVELADAMIRIADLAGALGLDLPGAIAEKMAFNAQRADHKIENRQAEGGKAF